MHVCMGRTHIIDLALGDYARLDNLPYFRHGRCNQCSDALGSFDLHSDTLCCLVRWEKCVSWICPVGPSSLSPLLSGDSGLTLDMRPKLHPPLFRLARHSFTILLESIPINNERRGTEGRELLAHEFLDERIFRRQRKECRRGACLRRGAAS